MRQHLMAAIEVRVATCYAPYCQNDAVVTMLDDESDLAGSNIINACEEHYLERFKQLMIRRVEMILDSPELKADVEGMTGSYALNYIRNALLGERG